MQSSPSEATSLLQEIHDTWSSALEALGALQGIEDDASVVRETVEASQSLVDRYREIERTEARDGSPIGEDRLQMLDSIRELHERLVFVLEAELQETDAKRHDLSTRHRAVRSYASPSQSGQHLTGEA